MRDLAAEIEALVARAGTHPVWGYAHCLRVYETARALAREEELDHDEEALFLAALLHDIGLYRAYNLREGRDHAERSASVATRILRDRNFPEERILLVADAIEHHPPGRAPGSSTESLLLKDAVILDYLGSIGLARIFAMVGLEEDVPDILAAFHHAQELRRRLPRLLRFATSRRIALDRCMEMDRFFGSLKDSSRGGKLL